MSKDTVAVIKAISYDDADEPLREGIKAIGGLPNLENCHVVIKPNLCAAKSPEAGATTHINIVRGIIKIINEKTGGKCRISIVESDAEGINADYAFKLFDYISLEKEFPNVTLVNLSRDAKMRIVLNDSKAFDLLETPYTLLDMDYFISVAKLKTHVDQRISCVLKNQFGLIPRKRKAVFHPFLSEVLYDLNSLYCPDLCIVDGIIGMEGFGPTDGSPKRVNVILVGTSSIATDFVAAQIMGFKPEQIPHLKYAMKNISFNAEDGLNLVGERILRDVKTSFDFISSKQYLLGRIGLRLQRWGILLMKLGDFIQKARSAISLVGLSTINSKVSFKDMIKIAKKMIIKITS